MAALLYVDRVNLIAFFVFFGLICMVFVQQFRSLELYATAGLSCAVIVLSASEIRRRLNVIPMLTAHTTPYMIAFDLEFTGVLPLDNQIVSIGAALLDVLGGKILSTFSSGLLGLEAGRGWHPKCLPWWQKDAGEEMRAMIPRINDHIVNHRAWVKNPMAMPKPDTRNFRDGVEAFIRWVNIQVDAIRRVDPNADIRFLTDTVSNDCSHLNAALDLVGHNHGLTYWFGQYRDVVYLDKFYCICQAAFGYTWNDLTSHPMFPLNSKKHDAEHDAMHIALQYNFCMRLLATHSMLHYYLKWYVNERPTTLKSYIALNKGKDATPTSTSSIPLVRSSVSAASVSDKKTD